MRLSRLLTFSITFIALSLSAVVQAQSCSALVDEALNAIGDNCEGLTRNAACYGYDRVAASFFEDVDEDFFTTPSDVTEILAVETISTAALDPDTGLWGVAVLSLQADIPNSVPGQAVTFVLMGDVEVENAATPDLVNEIPDPIDVTVGVSTANLRSGPGLNRNVVGQANNGDVLAADGLSRDGGWVRVLQDGAVSWIAAALLTGDSPLDDLPTLGEDTLSPMQSFYLRTGVGQPQCEEAPANSLMVQSPDNLEIELTVNGANVRVGSTVIFRILEPGDRMEIVVLEGRAITEDGTVIEEGFRSEVCLDAPQSRGVDGQANDRVVSCPWAEPERVPPTQLGFDWCALERIPNTTLTKPINLLCTPEEIAAFEAANIILIDDPNKIGSGERDDDDDDVYNTGLVDTGSANCAGFGIISPLAGAPANWSEFRWAAAPGAASYKVNFYDYQGNFGTSFFVPGDQTTLPVNMGGIPSGGSFQWEVMAFDAAGNNICHTGRTAQQTRLPDYNEPPGGYDNNNNNNNVVTTPSLGVNWVCVGAPDITINYSGLAPGDTVSIIYDIYDGASPISPGGASFIVSGSGSGVATTTACGAPSAPPYLDIKNATWFASPSGASGVLPNLFLCVDDC